MSTEANTTAVENMSVRDPRVMALLPELSAEDTLGLFTLSNSDESAQARDRYLEAHTRAIAVRIAYYTCFKDSGDHDHTVPMDHKGLEDNLVGHIRELKDSSSNTLDIKRLKELTFFFESSRETLMGPLNKRLEQAGAKIQTDERKTVTRSSLFDEACTIAQVCAAARGSVYDRPIPGGIENPDMEEVSAAYVDLRRCLATERSRNDEDQDQKGISLILAADTFARSLYRQELSLAPGMALLNTAELEEKEESRNLALAQEADMSTTSDLGASLRQVDARLLRRLRSTWEQVTKAYEKMPEDESGAWTGGRRELYYQTGSLIVLCGAFAGHEEPVPTFPTEDVPSFADATATYPDLQNKVESRKELKEESHSVDGVATDPETMQAFEDITEAAKALRVAVQPTNADWANALNQPSDRDEDPIDGSDDGDAEGSNGGDDDESGFGHTHLRELPGDDV